MSGKVYIGGTAYDITAGKTMVGGTAYDITAGKTMVGGTSYDILFNQLRRPSSFRDLIEDMTLITDVSVNQKTSTSSAIIPRSSLPSSGVAYFFSMCRGYLGIWRADGATINSTPIMYGMIDGYGGISIMNDGIAYNGRYSTNSRTAVNASSLVMVNFPTYEPEGVELILSSATYTYIAGFNGMSTSTVRTQDQSHNYYLAARYKSGSSTGYGADTSSMQFWEPASSSWTQVANITPDWIGSSVDGGYLTLGSVYGGSIIAIDEPVFSTWTLNNYINLDSLSLIIDGTTINVNFTSNNTSFTKISLYYYGSTNAFDLRWDNSNWDLIAVASGRAGAASASRVVTTEYRTITFTDVSTVSASLLEWLSDNATPVG